MARPRSDLTLVVKAKLIARLRDGFHAPGQRFFSNRALSSHFGVSYQTAHRLIQELVAEGWLERRAAVGTYVAGSAAALSGAELLFHERARSKGSFGARLLAELKQGLELAGVDTRVAFTIDDGTLLADSSRLPVLWDCPQAMVALASQRRFLVVLNDRPPPGLASGFVDSVATDDFSGGVAAAELLEAVVSRRKLAVFAGPKQDRRSQQRVAGFLSHAPKAMVIWAESWFASDAARVAPQLAGNRFEGIFCCNDRLAEALLAAGTSAAVVGFDDAPVAERLDLTTIAVPWAAIVAAAVDVVRGRLAGRTGAAAQHIFAPLPVVRGTLERGTRTIC